MILADVVRLLDLFVLLASVTPTCIWMVKEKRALIIGGVWGRFWFHVGEILGASMIRVISNQEYFVETVGFKLQSSIYQPT